MKIKSLDHLVLTVADIEKTIAFYTHVMGFEVVTLERTEKHSSLEIKRLICIRKDMNWSLKAETPTCGSADLCFIAETGLHEIMEELRQKKYRNH